MKQLVLVVLALSFFSGGLATEVIQVSVGADLAGKHILDSDSFPNQEYDTKLGLSPSFELLAQISPRLLIGGGIEYQTSRGLDVEGFDMKFNFLPLFMSFKATVSSNPTLNIELIEHVGYNIFYANKEYKDGNDLGGGLYLGFGAGIVTEPGFTIELMYRMHEGCLKHDLYHDQVLTRRVSQTNFTLRFGYRL